LKAYILRLNATTCWIVAIVSSKMPGVTEFLKVLQRDGYVRDARARLTPLGGGVSSEIFLVEDGAERFVVKRALAKLKVKDDWFADVGRNASEWKYLEWVGRELPGCAPKVRFANADGGYFGMEFMGEGFVNWKQSLMAGDCQTHHAAMAGRILGQIHARTRDNAALREQFDTTVNFRQLRLEPYLLTTGARHPEWREAFAEEAERIESTREALVHGDFSPKNILIHGSRMVLLDAEVAWYGDAAFDVAFLLNHLFLKGLRHAPRDLKIENMIDSFWRQYLSSAGQDASELEARVLRLLPLLMLARVDGKSPVEYLDASRQDFVRRFVFDSLRRGKFALAPFLRRWRDECGTFA
jgi:aminoglycoside phosphotransferase (APT) family kinase protein